MTTPAWLVYERCVAVMVADKYGATGVVIQPNARLTGHISGKLRQVDVLVDSRYPDVTRDRMIVDAKQRRSRVDIKAVEAFEGMMKDCQASRGVIVCTAGWTDGAQRRAQDTIAITLLSVQEALEYDWALDPCLGDCDAAVQQRGIVLWDGPIMPELYDRPAHVVRVGKCDRCHQFHVWCFACGRKFIVPDAAVARCDCCKWMSVPEAAESEDDGVPDSVWLMILLDGMMIPADRRPIESLRMQRALET